MSHAAALLAFLLGCDWSLHRMQEQPRCDTHGATPLLPGGACDLVPPEGSVPADEPEALPRVTRELLARGGDRFTRMCAPCHGIAGDGDSDVARAMVLRRPPSLVDPVARSLPDDRILFVIASGYGVMPGYSNALAPPDRYAVLHYVRALQQREVALDELPPVQREEAMRWLR